MSLGRRMWGALAGALVACSPGSGDDEARWNVVIALVDTLRADHLGLYGYDRPTSPNLDRFAQRAIVFENARAQAPCTFPSANSLLTGRDPAAFRNQLALMIGIPRSIPTLAEQLAGRGWETLAVSASVVVRATRSDHNRYGGFAAGFDTFDEHCEEREAACVNERLFAWLDAPERAAEPFFAYLHYVDPHDPYQPPASFERRFARARRGPAYVVAGNPNPLARRLARGDEVRVPDADLQHLVDLYDDEIAYFDAQLASLLDGLEQRGRLERTLFVLLSDHGEDFLETRWLKHCRSVRDTQVRTPLVVRVPGDPGGRVVRAAVGNVDVVPTVLDYLGLEPGGPLDGRSLRPWIEGTPGASAPIVFSAWSDWRSAAQGRFKLILHVPSAHARLFDLQEDPGETRDVARDHPDVASRLREAVVARIATVEARRSAPAGAPGGARERATTPGDDTTKRLEALGYLE